MFNELCGEIKAKNVILCFTLFKNMPKDVNIFKFISLYLQMLFHRN